MKILKAQLMIYCFCWVYVGESDITIGDDGSGVELLDECLEELAGGAWDVVIQLVAESEELPFGGFVEAWSAKGHDREDFFGFWVAKGD